MSLCLVTGGAGFLGCALSPMLSERFDHVIALDCLHPQVHSQSKRPPSLHANVELLRADVRDQAIWDKLLAKVQPDTVIHLAAETGTGQSLTEGTRHSSVNVTGTTQMLDAFSRHGCRPNTIILASSRAVYGEGAWKSRADGCIFYPGLRSKDQLERGEWDFPNSDPLPMGTDREPRPTSIYGATKLAQEHIIDCWCSAFGVNAAILRLQNVYGPGQSLTNSYTGIVSLFGRQALAGQRIEVYEDGQISRDFVYIDDVANAFISTIDKAFGSVSSKDYILDIGSGVPTTVELLAAMIAGTSQRRRLQS